LRRLLDGCRAGDPSSLEQFVHWLSKRGAAVLRGFGLSKADQEDVVARARDRIISAINRRGIRGDSNAEIDAYVVTTLRRHALNLIRTRIRQRETGEHNLQDIADEQLSQEARVIMNEQINRVLAFIQTWTAADRYLFMAKLHDVPASTIQQTLAQPPYDTRIAVGTVDTRFHRLCKSLAKDLGQS